MVHQGIRYQSKHLKSNHRKHILEGICAVLMIAFLFIAGWRIVNVNANRVASASMKKEYISVEIKDGDTLWGIGKEYIGAGYSDLDAFVEDIKSVNGLRSDTIHAGNFLLVPRYVLVTDEGAL